MSFPLNHLLLPIILLFTPAILCNDNDKLIPVRTVRSFVSRPDLLVPRLNIRTYDADAVASGYIFVSTWEKAGEGEKEAQSAPYIFRSDGELVWSGYDASFPSVNYFNLQAHTLRRNGTGHEEMMLSVFRGSSEHGRGKGHVALLDQSYNVVQMVKAPKGFHALDFHEFQLTDDHSRSEDGLLTAIVVALEPVQADLRLYGIGQGMGWLLDSCFAKMDVKSGDTLFKWCAAKHVEMYESILHPSAQRAAGLAFGGAFDYFHINSVDVFGNGDYLVSARHTDTVYCVNGSDGSIIWRLGGMESSFAITGFNFSAQHDVRVVSEIAGNKTLISLFNNGFNGEQATAETSSAMLIELDFERMSASLAQQWFPAESGLAQNQGSVQHLPSNHTLVSWGMVAEFTEFDAQGNTVLDVAFVDIVTRAYRVRKAEWTGMPDDVPALHLYARDTSSPAHFWMSWNGATEVKTWRISASSSHEGDTHRPDVLGSIECTGFETHFVADRFVDGGFVEALDNKGNVLGQSDIQKVVLPSTGLRDVCADGHCMLQMLPAEQDGAEKAALPHAIETSVDSGMAWWISVLQWLTVFFIGIAVGRISIALSKSSGR